MKLYKLIITVLLIGLFACKDSENKIVIKGEIIGEIPEKVEYTNPIHGICNWNFTSSVQPDSLGKFEIEIESKEPVFIKIRTSYTEHGTLIAEPGKDYDIRFNLTDKENIFSVTDKSVVIQEIYNKFPNPEHIQDGAREFLRYTIATEIKQTIEQRKRAEIAKFEKLLSDKLISREIFDLVKTDRTCYYDAVLATVAWIKKLMVIQGREKVFTKEFENLWKGTFVQPLFSNPKILKSQWFNFYAESYIYFLEYINGNYTKEKLEAFSKAGQSKSNRVNNAKKYLPAEFYEDYLANYLFEESLQKKYEKELIGLYNDFKTDYPESEYNRYISPLIDVIIEFHETANSDFSENIEFVENYQKLNTLNEVASTLPKAKIYVDVWASWCGPCKIEFAHKKELDSLLQKNNIQMLYLSIDRDRDTTQWKNMIKFYNLEGFHIRANEELNSELRKLFDKNGSLSIPWYILIDNNGKILKKFASRPSQIEKLANELNEIN